MIDQEILREAVELADGFGTYKSDGVLRIEHPEWATHMCYPAIKNCPQWALDALAAQLISQVEAAGYLVWEYPTGTQITDSNRNVYFNTIAYSRSSPTRTERRIIAATESGVLKK